jgi:hypothetical protein
MARKPRVVSNSCDAKVLEGYLTEIDAADDKLAEPVEYMRRCKGPRRHRRRAPGRQEAGIPRAFKAIVKNCRLDRRKAANIARLEADDAVTSKGRSWRLATGDNLWGMPP